MAKHSTCWLDAYLSTADLNDYYATRQRAATIALAARTLSDLKPGPRAELRAAILAAPSFPASGESSRLPPSERAARPSSARAGSRNLELQHG